MTPDDLATRLLATFVGELEEQVRVMNAELLALEAEPEGRDRLHALFRVAHTLKGAARAAGVPLVEQTCHALEGLLAQARDGTRKLAGRDFELLFASADALSDAAGRLRDRQPLASAPIAALHEALRGDDAQGAFPEGPLPAPESPPRPTAADGFVRVQSEKLDALLASGSDLLVTGGRVGLRAADLEALQVDLGQWAARWRQGSRGLRLILERAGAASLETRILGMGEELQRLTREAARLASAARADARALARSVDEVLGQARSIRMRPFSEACEALPRAVRDLAAAAGKQVELEVAGGDVEADRAVLDSLREALLQLVRNAVDHGIEPAEQRAGLGKPRRGKLRVAAELRGDRLLVTVADDGSGLDAGAIKEELARRGFAPPAEEQGLIQALFEARLSTRAEATTISGRGVGLDVVRAATTRIGGRVDVEWKDGAGTVFSLDCPVTLASLRALLVSVASHVVAIPVSSVERARRVSTRELRTVEGRTLIPTPEGPVPVVSLARLLPPLAERSLTGDVVPLVLLRAGPRRLAVTADELLEVRELAVRPVRAGPSPLASVRGVALLATGQIALVVEPAALVTAGLRPDLGSGVTLQQARVAPVRRRILVVDDSITTRTLERSILETAGYEVLTAVDGDDGWRVLQEQGCDVVVADVEMPRMDGFALCETIRGSRRFAELPVVLVTALERPEDRARGHEAGADAYIGKSSFDQQNLLDTIDQLLA